MKKGLLGGTIIVFLSLCYLVLARETVYCNNVEQPDGTILQTNCCEYDSNERDASEGACIECGHLWSGETCCDDVWDNYCIYGVGSCINGVSYKDHCADGIMNCDETGQDCGGGECFPCCGGGVLDYSCAPSCGADEDIDCCSQLFEEDIGAIPWADDKGCCNTNDYWCSNQYSCVSGKFFTDHCSDGVLNCGEDGPDCGGSCNTCYLISDNTCSFLDLLIYKESDPDCCNLLGGTFSSGRCCWSGGSDWCEFSGGSCVNGVYYDDHCQDGVVNSFCAQYNNGQRYTFNSNYGIFQSNLDTFISEVGVDCGGDCAAC